MDIKISYTELSSFVGDVRPIWLSSDENLKYEPIRWKLEGDAVEMKRFGGCDHGAFSYGVLITFVKAGTAVVTATYDNVTYTCRVQSREKRDFSGEKLNFYKGDLHTHTSTEHVHDKFISRKEQLFTDYLNYIKEENLRDLAVMTDHAGTTDVENFFRSFTDYESMREEMEPIVFAGSESEISYVEKDRFGRLHRRSGELVTINANDFANVKTYEEFYTAYTSSPFVIGSFAHPHVMGYSTSGLWDYRPRLNNSAELRRIVKYIEVFGNPRKENMLHEYVYSEALDGGYRIAPLCNSDYHREWDFTSYPGATIIMAPEKSREAFLDALLNLRACACESGNIKLTYSVNGKCAPCDVSPDETKYHFSVNIDYFYEDAGSRPIKCEVISNGGVAVKTFENINFESFEFDIESSEARWFYLRFVDSNTKRTISCPVFCGREVIPYKISDLKPIDPKDFKVWASGGSDASALIDGDTMTNWVSDGTSCEITLDMGCVRKISALGNYAAAITTPYPPPPNVGLIQGEMEAMFPVDYTISTSTDGVNFVKRAEGIFRTFTGEEIIRFDTHEARYVKLVSKETTGKRLGREPYDAVPMKIAEISLFE